MPTNCLEVLQKAHSPLKASVYLDRSGDHPSVIKDYSASPTWLRKTLCQFMLRREIRTLQKLQGIEGIPEYLGSDRPHSFRMQYVQGHSPSPELLGITSGLLDQLTYIVEQMHARGVTHNDLRPNNLLLTENNRLYLIDFGAVVYRPQARNILTAPAHWFFSYLANTDKSKMARFKARYRPTELTVAEQQLISATQLARRTTQWWKKYVLPIISPTKHRRK